MMKSRRTNYWWRLTKRRMGEPTAGASAACCTCHPCTQGSQADVLLAPWYRYEEYIPVKKRKAMEEAKLRQLRGVSG